MICFRCRFHFEIFTHFISRLMPSAQRRAGAAYARAHARAMPDAEKIRWRATRSARQPRCAARSARAGHALKIRQQRLSPPLPLFHFHAVYLMDATMPARCHAIFRCRLRRAIAFRCFRFSPPMLFAYAHCAIIACRFDAIFSFDFHAAFHAAIADYCFRLLCAARMFAIAIAIID